MEKQTKKRIYKTDPIMIRKELAEKVRRIAEKEGRFLQVVASRLLEKAIAEYEKQNGAAI